MEQEQGRPLAHGGTVGHKLRAFDIEEQPDPVHGHVHVPVSLMNGSFDQVLACSEGETKPYRSQAGGFGSASHNSGALHR